MLIVSFLSLGVRTGLVVALCILLVISGVLLTMGIVGINYILGSIVIVTSLFGYHLIKVKIDDKPKKNEVYNSKFY